MPKKKLSTLLVFVQDETGSMMERREATVSAFNEYFETLQRDAASFGRVTVNVWQFSESPGEDRVRLVHDGPLAKVPKLNGNYRPRGVTPLLDAVGTALQQAGGVTADRYLFVVQTDGLENASKDFTREQVAQLVGEKEKAENWTLVFLGAGVTEWKREVAAMGGAAGSVGAIGATGPSGVTGAYASLATNSSSLLRSDSASDKRMAMKVERDAKARAR